MLSLLMKKNVVTEEKGFTLIEVMAAVAIFIIGIIGCYQLQVAFSSMSSRANCVATASTWAQYMAEELLGLQYTSVFVDPLLMNSQGDAVDGLTDIDDSNGAGDTPDGVRYVTSTGSISTVANASDTYTIFWNIKDNWPLKSVKQMRIIVVKNSGLNSGRLYSQDYFKLGPI